MFKLKSKYERKSIYVRINVKNNFKIVSYYIGIRIAIF